MNNYLAMNVCEAIMPIKDGSVNVTIVTASGKVYNNVEIDDFDIIHHKTGDTYITPWGDSIIFKHDYDEVIINKVI